jgi:ubiquinone/menaquinone biosynthesis C-methylase UbiE
MLYPPTRLIAKLNIEPNSVVLDFGCGPGFFLIPLAKVTANTIGVDVSPPMLKRAEAYAKKSGVTVQLLQSDGTNIGLPDSSVDLVALIHVFHEVENKSSVLREFSRILKASGRLAIVERTVPGGTVPLRFGPPVVNEAAINEQLRQSAFVLGQSIPDGRDTIFIAKK